MERAPPTMTLRGSLAASAVLAAVFACRCSSRPECGASPARTPADCEVPVAAGLEGTYSRHGASPAGWTILLLPGGLFFESFASCTSAPSWGEGEWSVDGDAVVLRSPRGRDAAPDRDRRLRVVHDADGRTGLAESGEVEVWPGESIARSDCFWQDARSEYRNVVTESR